MTKLVVRKAAVSDTGSLRNPIKQLGYEVTCQNLLDNIDIFDTKTGHHVYVAESAGSVVGFISFHVMHWFHRPDAVARISAIAIDQRHRGLGIGRTLTQFTENVALKSGCTVIELTSSLARKAEGTYDFYSSLGYVDASNQSTCFRKELSSVMR